MGVSYFSDFYLIDLLLFESYLRFFKNLLPSLMFVFSTWEELSHRRNVTSCGGNSCPKTKNVVEKLIGALKIKDFMTSFYMLFCKCVAAWKVLSILLDFVFRAVNSLLNDALFTTSAAELKLKNKHKTQANNSRNNSTSGR